MATERKKRQAQKSTVDTSKLKEFASKHGGGESKGARRLRMAKSVKDEASKIQSQISREQEKAQKKSLWSSIGGALFGLAAGVATGGASWAVQGAAVGAGTYLGAHGGKKLAETEGGAKREKIKSDLWYTPEAEKQNLAFDDYEKELNKSIQDRALASGLLTAAVAGGGKLVEKIKEAKAAKAAKQLAEAKEALGIPKALEEAKEGYEYIMSSGAADASGTSITSTTGVTKPKTVQEGMEMLKGYTEEYSGVSKSVLPSKSGLPSDISVASGYDKISIDKSLGKKRYMISDALSESVGFGEEIVEDLALKRAPLSTSIKSQFAAATQLTAEAAPTMMDAYMTGLKGMASDYAQKSILASGAMGIYGYRPELQSLRPIQMMTPTYQTRQRTRTA